MAPEVLSWLRAQLGAADTDDDLATRYARLGSARAVAAEVLAERRADLLADPLRMTVDGVVTVDQTANLSGLERQLQGLAEVPAPDDPPAGGETTLLRGAPLVPVRGTR